MDFGRRLFIGFAGAGAASLLLFGRSAGTAATLHFPVNHTSAEWQRLLGPQRYPVLREAATEPPYTSPLLTEHRKGVFVCAACANPLYSSATKFDSHTGWPSFWQVRPGATVNRSDNSLMMERTEVLCARCGGHLGHVFEDGPRPTGLRYCMNGLALNFRAA
ncbi:MAG: peptide-methionine (R)-S-oxide reductase MsrB [Pseudomonadota bacterium]